ncbi:MAG: GntR family transcriptional regulator [bacterium]|nr:GntR family transcriptional regulator [bacterium]
MGSADEIDPASPIPLYHQIAEAIRGRIRSGNLGPGEALEPLRQAAETWGVNVHTVRHAYTALAREGLVETRAPRGTRVRERAVQPDASSRAESFEAFVERVVDEARVVHERSPVELADVIAARCGERPSSPPLVHVVECSAWQCAAHVRELKARFDVEACAWPLEEGTAPPEGGVVLSTFFHYNDVRRAWPERLRDVRFLTIVPDPALVTQLDVIRGDRRRLRAWVVERDQVTAENVAADVSVALPAARYELAARAAEEPAEVLRAIGEDEVALFAPRIWSALSEDQRGHPRALEARYVFDGADLENLAVDLGWRRAASPIPEKEANLRA